MNNKFLAHPITPEEREELCARRLHARVAYMYPGSRGVHEIDRLVLNDGTVLLVGPVADAFRWRIVPPTWNWRRWGLPDWEIRCEVIVRFPWAFIAISGEEVIDCAACKVKLIEQWVKEELERRIEDVCGTTDRLPRVSPVWGDHQAL